MQSQDDGSMWEKSDSSRIGITVPVLQFIFAIFTEKWFSFIN
jgi:hypothetical protein